MKLQNILAGNINNHIYPFMWVHGESEIVYRDTIRAINKAYIGGFCVEARPHPEFCREQWWQDMSIILDEAERLGMKVWILDDKHFPTGYANGAVEKAPLEQRRQSVLSKEIGIFAGKIYLNLREEMKRESSATQMYMDQMCGNLGNCNTFEDDCLISVVAIATDEDILSKKKKEPLLLNSYIEKEVLDWTLPEGKWQIVLTYLSRNAGTHRNYINMMDKESCRILINEVYETHYEHFKDKFGSVIAGFFSDEPELGNGLLYKFNNPLGSGQDLPWSRELELKLKEKLGDDYERVIPLLWNNDCDQELTAKVRYIYMDTVTRLVEEDFSKQIGMWCLEHGVEYIGHVIEDSNQHARTGTSLGHYFRGLKWQCMSGIDIIGGQIYPYEENTKRLVIWNQQSDPEFFHYSLAKLGSSLGALNPNMKNRTMCELFGNYGWSEGVQLEKYQLDHCMVRGINYFVPHAFSCKEYPDPDCPPHFYAHGNDPLYRYFGKLMSYTNRITSLLEGGYEKAPVAILYHAEAEWSGKCMLMQEPARILQNNQIDFHFVPCDVFEEVEFYQTKLGSMLTVNGKEHRLLIVPYAQYIPNEVANGIVELVQEGCSVVFINDFPEGTCQGTTLPEELRKCEVVNILELQDFLEKRKLQSVKLSPHNNRIRAMHYLGDEEVVYLFNEGKEEYKGLVHLPWPGESYCYDAWENRILYVKESEYGADISLMPLESCLLIRKREDSEFSVSKQIWNKPMKHCMELTRFQVSRCRCIDYPAFQPVGKINKPESFTLTDPLFSGFIAYETTFEVINFEFIMLEITEAFEGVEVFVNGQSASLQILPIYRFDLTNLCQEGLNKLRIEVATTLERENIELSITEQNSIEKEKLLAKAARTGLTGQVYLKYC